ncbi:rRNA maturation RNase YbeY [Leeuwenhoekiella polynyae]|uniref:Endoribonuclease YbeY n=1 Tax=Leeuwenhoekiella polynyae TaxID=1550906 RepID=A0A4Q0PIK4_9FLAO|nr:rRNA maturation RNase YbeY [Leeuwenhoekiella polynyae]RXG26428.1 rRNA maturation RNase YbeY [Leeuwenhoekiella polynyae]
MIEFSSQNDFVLDNEDRVEKWLKGIALKESYGIDSLGYIFCSDDFLLDINKRFLDHDTLTDIVTFDYTEDKILNGEIYISTDRVADNAEQFKVSFNTELLRVISHGLLHMCGYGDKTDEEKKTMRAKEDECLILWNA